MNWATEGKKINKPEQDNLLTFCVFRNGSDGKESVCNVGDPGLISGLGKSFGEGNGNLF